MLFGGYENEPDSRWLDGVPWDHAATLPAARLGALPAADGGRDPALPVPRRRRGGPPGLPSRRDDARREPAPRADAGRPRLLGRRRAVAERVRGRGRDRPGDGRLDHGGRPRRRHRAVPGVAVRATRTAIPGSSAGLARETYADYYRLRFPYDADVAGRPRRLSALHGRLQEARRRVRHEGRLGARRPTTTRAALAARRAATRRRYGWTTAALVRAGGGGASGRPRAGRASSTSARSARSTVDRAGRAGAAPARRRERRRPAGRQRRLHAVPRRAWRDRRRRHRRPPRRRPVPRRHRLRLPRRRPGLAAHARRRRRRSRCRSATSAATWRRSGCGGRARATSWRPPPVTTSATPRCRCARRGSIRVGRRGRRRGADQLRRRARLGADGRAGEGGRGLGRAACRRRGPRPRADRLPGARRRSGSRRAIATSAPS